MKTAETKMVERALAKKFARHIAFEVDLSEACLHTRLKSSDPNSVEDVGIADAIAVDNLGNLTCIEIKTSVKDFRDSKKLSFVGDKNAFAMTEELYRKVKPEIPQGIGVLTVDAAGCVREPRKPKWVEPRYGRQFILAAMVVAMANKTSTENTASAVERGKPFKPPLGGRRSWKLRNAT